MRKTKISLLLASTSFLFSTQTPAQIFQDDFESGNLNNWTTTVANSLTIDNTQNISPGGGTFSARLDRSTDRMHRNIIADNGGQELSGRSRFSYYIFDDGNTGTTGSSRVWAEVRGHTGTGFPNGGTTPDGTVEQLFAAGKTSAGTFIPGESLDLTKYQGRFTGGANPGWFNLSGGPDRSIGWHHFMIERAPDGTTINFYVDNVLGRTITGATASNWDTLILGPGQGTQVGDAWFDGISLTAIPEPEHYAMAMGFALLVFGGFRKFRTAAQ